MQLRWLLLAVCVLAGAAGLHACVSTAPRANFVAECITRIERGIERGDAASLRDAASRREGCEDKLRLVRLEQAANTILTTGMVAILGWTLVVVWLLVSAWGPLLWRRWR